MIYDNIDLINDCLRDLLKNININISHSTILLISELTVLLQRQFIGCKDHFPLICEKFKEKNEKMNKDIHVCLVNMITNTNHLGEYTDFLDSMLDDKSIHYKTSICEFILSAITQTYINTLKLFSFELTEIIAKLTEDTSHEIRTLAIKILAVLKVRLGSNFNDKSKKKL